METGPEAEAVLEFGFGSQPGTVLGVWLGFEVGLGPAAGHAAVTALETVVILGPVTERGPGFAVRPGIVAEPGSVAGTGPGVGAGFGCGNGDEFGPETEPGFEVGPVAESGVGTEFEMELVPGGGMKVEPSVGAELGLEPGPGVRFGFGAGTAPEVDFEKWAGLGVEMVTDSVAEAEPVPGGDSEVVSGPECVAFAGHGHTAELEFVHKFALDAGVEAEHGSVAAAEGV